MSLNRSIHGAGRLKGNTSSMYFEPRETVMDREQAIERLFEGINQNFSLNTDKVTTSIKHI